jgi:hypothetical protein
VYKLWHGVGLTPKIATIMKIYQGRDCPFCLIKEISANHYIFCPHFKPLWLYIFKILKKDYNLSSLKSISRGCGDDATNILIFYGINTIYKTFVLYLNAFEVDFDYLKHFKNLVFCRLLTEFQVCMQGGASKMSNFSRKFFKFKLYKIQNNKININLNI